MITPSHFLDRPYRIPNIEETTDIQAFIDFHEEKVLRALLGTTLYNDLVDGLAVTPTPLAIWTDLRDGSVYLYGGVGGVEYEFPGLIELLKAYIYSKWLRSNEDKVTNAGMMRNIVDKAEHVSPVEAIVWSYNQFSAMAGSAGRQENTLYGFLNENWDDYVTEFSDWMFNYPGGDPEFENQLGI